MPMDENTKEFVIDYQGAGSRLDIFLSEHLKGVSRSRIGKLVSEGLVLVEGKTVKAGTKLKEGAHVVVHLPKPRASTVEPEPIPINVVYEDEHVLVVDKPAGMVVHPSAGHATGTLVHALLHHSQKLSPIGGLERPGIVHRLDKDTSGLLIVAREEQSHLGLCEQLKERTLSRNYYAIVHGAMKENSGIIETEIGRHRTDRKKMWINPKRGRQAVTEFKVVERFKGFSLCQLKLQTGRTHQIRVHLASKGFPIVGDTVYGGKKILRRKGPKETLINRQALHAYKLGFIHPINGKKLEFESLLPQDMLELLDKIRV